MALDTQGERTFSLNYKDDAVEEFTMDFSIKDLLPDNTQSFERFLQFALNRALKKGVVATVKNNSGIISVKVHIPQ